jgi:hypothetical protein
MGFAELDPIKPDPSASLAWSPPDSSSHVTPVLAFVESLKLAIRQPFAMKIIISSLLIHLEQSK